MLGVEQAIKIITPPLDHHAVISNSNLPMSDNISFLVWGPAILQRTLSISIQTCSSVLNFLPRYRGTNRSYKSIFRRWQYRLTRHDDITIWFYTCDNANVRNGLFTTNLLSITGCNNAHLSHSQMVIKIIKNMINGDRLGQSKYLSYTHWLFVD